MTFKHKLAKRMAQNGPDLGRLTAHHFLRSLSTLALLALVTCTGEPGPGDPEAQNSIIQLSVWPQDVSVQPGEQVRFLAFGLTTASDSIPAVVTWSTTGGAISPDGDYTAGSDTGTFRVVATHAQRVWLTDSSAVSVSASSTDVVALALWPRNPSLTVGDSLDFWAVGLTSAGDTVLVDVVWSAEGGSVQGQGRGQGRYKPDRPGQHKVRASADSLADSTTVTTTDVPVASVGVNPGSVTLAVGQTAQLAATPRDAGGNALSGRAVTWTTSAAAVATVNGSGLVTAQGTGTATITATSEGQSGTASVTVSAVPVASVSVSPSSLSLTVGQTGQLTATARDASGNALSGRVVTWTTSAAGAATVNGSGLVTAQGAGTATITATSEGQSGTAAVTVSQVPVASVSVSPSSFSLSVGQTRQLTATPRDANGNVLTGRAVTWTTSAAGVATVNASGLVTAQGAGTATITATSEGQSGTAGATVLVPVASVSVSPSSLSLTVGQTGQLTATPRDANGNPLTGRTVTWTTSASGVATVNGSGLVTARGAGTATITATSEGQTGTASVTVTQAPVATVTVSPSSLSLPVGQAGQLTATLRDANGNTLTGRTVTWTTSAAGVATVNGSGLVTALALGTATITATSEGRSGTAAVSVTASQGQYPNQPAGAIPLHTWVMDFSSVVPTSPETNAQPWFFTDPSRLVWSTTVSDPTAPVNPSRVGRLEINPSNVSLPLYGNSIERLNSNSKFVPPSGAKKIYWSYWFKYLPGTVTYAYQFKQTEMFYSSTGGMIVATNGSETEPWYLEFYNWNGTTVQNLIGARTIVTGQWYHVEVVIDQTTWRHQMFVNGQPYIDGVASVHGIGQPQEFGLVWVYGGGGPGLKPLDRSIYMYWDQLYMSYVP